MALLENIRVFMRVVDLGSMSAAGRHLRMSPAVVSHRMMQLEQHVGVRLLNRTTRQVTVTEHGRAYYDACIDVVETVERAEAMVSGAGVLPRGNLRVTAPLSFGRHFLLPLIGSFRAQNPEVAVRLRLSDHLIDLLGETIDVAIRLAVMPDSSFIQRKIADCPRLLCASPGYLERNGMPETPDDLHNHQCLLLRFPGSQQFRWTLQTAGGPVTLPVAGALDADDSDVLTAWALSGQGIVLKPVFEIADHLKAKRLVPVLPANPPEPVVLAALYPHRRLVPAKVRSFADFMVAEAGKAVRTAMAGLTVQSAAKQ